MPDNHAFTLWCKGGRIGTYRTREKADEWLEKIASDPRQYLHIQEWIPGEHYNYVTFDDVEEAGDEKSS